MRRRLSAVAFALVATAVVLPPRSARAEDPRCQKWTLDLQCATSSPRVVVGEVFTATVTAKNTGDAPLNNVTLRLRGDQGAPCVSGPSTGVMLLVERLEPGQARELSAKFASETIGMARILGSAKDSLGWASASCACSVEVAGLMAIQSEMTDKALDGSDRGVFSVAEEFLYVLLVENDVGTSATADLEVLLTLPKELAFVSGRGDAGITVTGSGQAAKTSVFVLGAPDQKVRIEFRVRVLAIPPSQLVKANTTVQTTAGIALTSDSESTTLK